MLIFSDRENTETLPQTIKICLHRELRLQHWERFEVSKIKGGTPSPLNLNIPPHSTLGPAYNEFGYNERPATKSRFLSNKIIDCNVKRFGYNEHPLITSTFFCIFLSVVHGTQCSSITWP